MKDLFRKTMLAAAVVAAVSLTAGAGFAGDKAGAAAGKQAYERCDHDGRHEWGMYGKAAWKKTLTAEQKTELGKLQDSFKNELSSQKAALNEKKEAARTIVASETPDREALSRLTGEIAALEKGLMDARYGHMIKVRALLNPEQKAAFDAALKKGERTKR
jgi:Spy/CpxP family protein refolding chaperone